MIFIGCGEGLVRCFSPHTLQVRGNGNDGDDGGGDDDDDDSDDVEVDNELYASVCDDTASNALPGRRRLQGSHHLPHGKPSC